MPWEFALLTCNAVIGGKDHWQLESERRIDFSSSTTSLLPLLSSHLCIYCIQVVFPSTRLKIVIISLFLNLRIIIVNSFGKSILDAYFDYEKRGKVKWVRFCHVICNINLSFFYHT